MSQEPIVLTSEDWINILWIVTRVTTVVGHPPSLITLEDTAPSIIWGDRSDFVAILNVEDSIVLHISEELPEAVAMVLVGICTVREIKWEFVEDPASEIESPGPVITSFMLR